MVEKKTIEARFQELMTLDHAKVVQLLFARNPLKGWTPATVSKVLAAEALMRYEFGPKAVREWKEKELIKP